MTNELKKLYLVADETMKKMKDRLTTEKTFNILDAEMKNILGKRMKTADKWLLYRNALQKFFNFRRRTYDEAEMAASAEKEKKSRTNRRGNWPPLKRTKLYDKGSDTRDLLNYVHPKRHSDTQTPFQWNAKDAYAQTRIPFKFDQQNQTQPTMRSTETDTVDLDPDEIFSSSRIEDDNFLDANDTSTFGRPSLVATPSARSVARNLRPEPVVVAKAAAAPLDTHQTVEIYDVKYTIPTEDEYDFKNFATEWFKTHPTHVEIDLDEFDDWLRALRARQDNMLNPSNDAQLRALHGPYTPKRPATVASSSGQNTSLNTSKSRKKKKHNTSRQEQYQQPSVAKYYKKTKTQTGKNIRQIKWSSFT